MSFALRTSAANSLWLKLTAHPKESNDGSVSWYGNFTDVTERKEYIQSHEKMVFDISHVIRRPVTSMLGFAQIVLNNDCRTQDFLELMAHAKTVFKELDDYTREMNINYENIQNRFTGRSCISKS